MLTRLQEASKKIEKKSKFCQKIREKKTLIEDKSNQNSNQSNKTIKNPFVLLKRFTEQQQLQVTNNVVNNAEDDDINSVCMSPLIFESSDSETSQTPALNIGIQHNVDATITANVCEPLTNEDIFQIFSGLNDLNKSHLTINQFNNKLIGSQNKIKMNTWKSKINDRFGSFFDKNDLKCLNDKKHFVKKSRRMRDCSVIVRKNSIQKQIGNRKITNKSLPRTRINSLNIEIVKTEKCFPFVSNNKCNLNERKLNGTCDGNKLIKSSSDSLVTSKSSIISKEISNTSEVQIISSNSPSIIRISSDSMESMALEKFDNLSSRNLSPDLFSSIDIESQKNYSLNTPIIPPNQFKQHTCNSDCNQLENIANQVDKDRVCQIEQNNTSNVFEITKNCEFANVIKLNEQNELTQNEIVPTKQVPITPPSSNSKSIFAGLKILPRYNASNGIQVIDLISSSSIVNGGDSNNEENNVKFVDYIAASQSPVTAKRGKKLMSDPRDSSDDDKNSNLNDTPKSSKANKWLSKRNWYKTHDRDNNLPNHLLSRRRLDLWFRDTINCKKTKSLDRRQAKLYKKNVTNICLSSDDDTLL